jgi:hypothetical protein
MILNMDLRQAQLYELELLKDEEKKLQVIRNSLDPLLERLLKDYTDERDLSSRLLSLFKECILIPIVNLKIIGYLVHFARLER